MVKHIPKPGTQREVKRFALFPIRIDREIRWLERVTIRQEFTEQPAFIFGRYLIKEKWVNKEFIKRGNK